MPVRHVVIHQLDPRRPVVGGIDGFIRELIAHAPSSHTFALVGVDGARRHSALGRWEEVVLAGRAIRFLPVARLDPGDQARKVPHSARLIAGLLRYRPDIEGGIIHTHRAEVGAVAAALYPRVQRVQFIHGDGRSSLVHKVETFWRFAPRV